MTDKRWKAIERFAAGLFGTVRRAGSGSWKDRHPDEGGDDIDHPAIYLEVKHCHKKRIPGRNLWKDTVKAAQEEGKTPVVLMHQKYTAPDDSWIWIRPKDLLEVALIYEIARDKEAKEQLETEEEPPDMAEWKTTFAERLIETLQRLQKIIGDEVMSTRAWDPARRRHGLGRLAQGFERHWNDKSPQEILEKVEDTEGRFCPRCKVRLVDGPEVGRCPKCGGIFPHRRE